MRILSPRARALLRALNDTPDVLERLRGAQGNHQDALLRALADQQEPALVLPLFRKVLYAQDGEARALALALHPLVSGLGPDDVRALDQALRQASFYETGYLDLGAQHLDAYAALSPSVVALLTCHPSGYLRQPALLRLGGSGSGAAWPFLLVRLNDWVHPVREAALQAAMAALPAVPLKLLVRHFPLVEALRQYRRADHAPFVEQVMARLRQPDALAWLAANLGTLVGRSRRMAFRLVVERSEELARPLVESALDDPDPVVKGLAAGRVEQLFSGEELLRMLARMERSRSMGVRREAYVTYARRFPGLGEAKVREALLDSSRSIRDYAQRRLSGTVDVAGLYREALRESSPRTGALTGMGETGHASDARLLAPFLAHPRASVRREAVTAMGRLDGEGCAEALRELLGDPVPSVSRAAAHALAQGPRRITSGWLRRCLFQPGLPPHAVGLAFQLTEALPSSEALLLLIEATDLPEAAHRELAHHHLRRWMYVHTRRFSSGSTPIPLGTLRQAVRTARNLEPRMALELDHLLRGLE
ncbi:HEAT repeat domain-containing protein [Archangium gephyra]|uniref:HEAT repeat domain-containing protein n=1 Tax=Archangium gephyra TaxID=48 RepID=UPI003B775E1E